MYRLRVCLQSLFLLSSTHKVYVKCCCMSYIQYMYCDFLGERLLPYNSKTIVLSASYSAIRNPFLRAKRSSHFRNTQKTLKMMMIIQMNTTAMSITMIEVLLRHRAFLNRNTCENPKSHCINITGWWIISN